MGRRERAVNGLGTAPLITSPRITETTGSDALITKKRRARRRTSTRRRTRARVMSNEKMESKDQMENQMHR